MGKVTTAVALALLLVTSMTCAQAATRKDYQQAYQKAAQEHQRALSLNNAWTTTEKVLHKAKSAAASGKYGEAHRLAVRAYELAERAVGQAREQRTAWKKAVPK